MSNFINVSDTDMVDISDVSSVKKEHNISDEKSPIVTFYMKNGNKVSGDDQIVRKSLSMMVPELKESNDMEYRAYRRFQVMFLALQKK